MSDSIQYEFLQFLTQPDFDAINELLKVYESSANRDRIEEILTEDYIAVARNAEGVIVGMAELVVYNKLTTGPTALIEDVVVLESYRCHGIGRTIWHMLVEKARERGCKYYFFTSNPTREAAHHLYKEVLGIEPWRTTLFRQNLK